MELLVTVLLILMVPGLVTYLHPTSLSSAERERVGSELEA